ncbi:HPt (histidine-containing phosphotransfer) domain-containing protein [Halopseudomonas xinjiangensis]|uniref:HPt (Histidine-containing phosphotransfer) domain-containing protein n=1 Tax=Halopseudomonas xinjiangensis TaxID=487184 RepID=A0A1H1MTP3_9GAMM|nr:Hpt domain-containing protein [Halopseudomonas xinjiangensis]SDR89299.1 HPt (histidine-containing phosphotransfer) domain-containing protein [Halopseudomonas xinjiangensis]
MTTDLPDIDPSVQNALRELMQDDYRLLVETFLNDALRRLTDLREALLAGRWDAFRQSAHSFRGSCGNMGALALERTCSIAERAGLERDATAAEGALVELELLHARIVPLMRSRLDI